MLPQLLERAGTGARGLDHRPVHGARRGRRHERADRRRRPRHPRRPRRARPRARAPQPLPGDRRAAVGLARCAGDHDAASRAAPPAALREVLATYRAQGGPDLDRRLPARVGPARSTTRSTMSDALDGFLAPAARPARSRRSPSAGCDDARRRALRALDASRSRPAAGCQPSGLPLSTDINVGYGWPATAHQGGAGLLHFMKRFTLHTRQPSATCGRTAQTAAMMALADRHPHACAAQAAAERSLRRHRGGAGGAGRSGRPAACWCRPIATATRPALGLETAAVDAAASGASASTPPATTWSRHRQALESVRKLEQRRRDEHRARPAAGRGARDHRRASRRARRRAMALRPACGRRRVSVAEALARVSAIQSQIAALAPPPAPTTDVDAFGSMLDAQLGDRRQRPRRRSAAAPRSATPSPYDDMIKQAADEARRPPGAGQGGREGRVGLRPERRRSRGRRAGPDAADARHGRAASASPIRSTRCRACAAARKYLRARSTVRRRLRPRRSPPTTPAPAPSQKYGGIPPYAETQAYVPKVLAYFQQFGGATGGTGAPASALGVERRAPAGCSRSPAAAGRQRRRPQGPPAPRDARTCGAARSPRRLRLLGPRAVPLRARRASRSRASRRTSSAPARRSPRTQLQPGDLVFFQKNGDVHHVGIYVGGGTLPARARTPATS